ncbi:MAG: hypothetical protein P8X48_04005 [Acidiferrobacteraceae bacterium]|jgi:hypothetical protein
MRKILLVAVAGALLVACTKKEPTVEPAKPRVPFESAIQKPEWFDTVSAPTLNSVEDVDHLWQSKKRCCIDEDKLQANKREFYKACYNGVVEHPDDDELVVKCLWLMDPGAGSDQYYILKRYLVENYGDHKSDTSHCANCAPGDVIARVSLSLARHERYADSVDTAINRIEGLLSRRRPEISLWVQTEIYTALGRMYLKSAVTDERKQVIGDAYERLASAATEQNGVSRRLPDLEKVRRELMAR